MGRIGGPVARRSGDARLKSIDRESDAHFVSGTHSHRSGVATHFPVAAFAGALLTRARAPPTTAMGTAMKAIMATADGGAGAVWVLKPGCDVLESPWLKPQWPSAPGTKDR